jgi:hypothetical protein
MAYGRGGVMARPLAFTGGQWPPGSRWRAGGTRVRSTGLTLRLLRGRIARAEYLAERSGLTSRQPGLQDTAPHE